MKKLLIILLIFSTACSTKKNTTPASVANKYSDILKNADSISVGYIRESKDQIRVSSIHEKDKGMFAGLNEILNEKEEHCPCKANGFMEVYVKDSIALSLSFTTALSGSGKECSFIVIKKEGNPNQCYRLTERMASYLDGVYHDITTE